MENKNAWLKYDNPKPVMDFAEDYRNFISNNKIERECAAFFIEEAKKDGFRSVEEVRKSGKKLKAGDKVYASAMGKSSPFSKSEKSRSKTE